MRGNSKSQPARVVDLLPGYQIRWDIQEKTTEEGTMYDYECNSVYIPSKLTKKEVMIAIIRERYDANDELELAYGRQEDVTKLQEHESYVEFARTEAETIMNEYEEI
jgi:hypothetical protein